MCAAACIRERVWESDLHFVFFFCCYVVHACDIVKFVKHSLLDNL